MKFSRTGEEKGHFNTGDCFIEVSTCVGLTVSVRCIRYFLGILWCRVKVRIMVFNATFNNIAVISWQSVLLVEEV